MNAFVLMIPLFLIRFGLLKLINKDALSRASLFAPVKGNEKIAYVFYQISNIFVVVYPFFLKIRVEAPLFQIALGVYLFGIVVLIVSTIHFAKPQENGLNTNGIYKLSRNPMYVGYFLYYLGCVLLTRSVVLFVSLLIFQLSAHWIILSEERWCIQTFGSSYTDYMAKVRRYL